MKIFPTRLFSTFPRWLYLLFAAFITLSFLASYLKFFFLLYNSLDLAIFNHTFWQTAQGNLFSSSINPPTYFGDHFGPLLILITPIYYLYQSEVTLLFLQTVFIGISAFPLYLIAKKHLSEKWSALLVVSWLFNPFLGSLNLFEWHIISILPFLLLLLWYFFIKKKFIAFLITLVVTLLVREDAGIATTSLALVMFFFKKENSSAIKYALTTILASTLWVYVALKIVATFSITESFKFYTYYGWLGSTPYEIFTAALTSPTDLFTHLLTLDALGLFFILLLPILYLVLLAPIFLLGIILPLLTLLLAKEGASPLIPFLHYSAWLLPSIYLGAIYGLKNIFTGNKNKFIHSLSKRADFIFITLGIALLYFFITLNPVSYTFYTVAKNYDELSNEKTAKEIILSKIEDSMSVITTADFLTPLSKRAQVHYLRYLYSNRYQLASKPYDFPTDNDFILFRPNDLVYYELLTRGDIRTTKDRGKRLNTYIIENKYKPLIFLNDYLLYTNKAGFNFLHYEELENLPGTIINNENTNTSDPILVHGWKKIQLTNDHILLTTYSTKKQEFVEPIYYQITIFDDKNNELYKTIAPQSFGLVSTADWPVEIIIKSSMLIDISKINANSIDHMKLVPIQLSATNTLNRTASTVFIPDEIIEVGNTSYLEVVQ